MEIDPSMLMNIATALFLLASIPQTVTTFQRRKEGLKDFNLACWFIGLLAVSLMGIIGFMLKAWATVAIEGWHVLYHMATIYWMIKYRRKDNGA